VSRSRALVCALPLCPFFLAHALAVGTKAKKIVRQWPELKMRFSNIPLSSQTAAFFPSQPLLEVSSPFPPFFLQAHYATRQATSISFLCLFDPFVLSFSFSSAVLFPFLSHHLLCHKQEGLPHPILAPPSLPLRKAFPAQPCPSPLYSSSRIPGA